ncbi:MAG: transketolase family protein [Gammaproteobacteria bacterium]
MRDTFITELTRQAKLNPNIILLTGDLGFGVLDDFANLLPNQFLNVGVAEQNMAMVAAGLALEGKKVFTYSIGNFPTLRCLEQIRNDICYHDLDVTIVSIGGGFSYGQLGMSHHATEDLSIMRAMPNMVVSSPSNKKEVKKITNYFCNSKGPSYLRLDKSFVNVEKFNFSQKKASVLREGSSITLIGTGGVVEELLKASDILKNQKIDCRVLSMHTIKPLDFISINKAVEETKGIISVEENNIIGGLGSAISEYCLEAKKIPKNFYKIGLNDEFSSIVGDQNYLRNYYQINSKKIIKKVQEIFC